MIKPLSDKVLIRIEEDKNVTETGIYLPDDRSKERPGEGTVEAVGSAVKSVKAKDRVLFVRHGHFEIKDEYKIIISEEDILAKIV